MSSWFWKAGLAGVAVVVVTGFAVAQMPGHQEMHGPVGQMKGPGRGMHGMMMGTMHGQPGGPGQGMMGMMHGPQGGHHMMMGGHSGMSGQPTMAGQDAFGAIQEVVQKLEADLATDWFKVNIAALREHLIDMNEVTLHAVAAERTLNNGIEIAVTGEGRTREAIKRMVPAHARELAANGWQLKTDDLPDGVKLTVTTSDPKQVVKLKALGFMGIMVQGAHHQPHHLAMAKGEHVH